jgi:hypothetical protein
MSRQQQSQANNHTDRSGYFDTRIFIAGALALVGYGISVVVLGL